MSECPNCEYHRQRAQLWRHEAYRISGNPLPEREDDLKMVVDDMRAYIDKLEQKLKEKST